MASDKLIAAGLRFGNLLRIDQPNLIDRYRRAMEGLGLPPTKLDVLYVDAFGYSAEVADELGDQKYLDPNGVSRRFIILTPEQRNLPTLNASFSVDVTIMRQFYTANDRAIRTLTLKDAVYGEIENLLFEVEHLSDILDLRTVTFSVHTPTGILECALRLAQDANKYLEEPAAWMDEALADAIVQGAKRCGDVRTNGILPEKLQFAWPDVFRTEHFGGIYVLRQDGETLIVGDRTKAAAEARRAGADFAEISDAAAVFKALRSRGWMEPLNDDWLLESGVVEQRLKLLVAELLCASDPSFDPGVLIGDGYDNKWIHRNLSVLKKDARFVALMEMRQLLGNNGDTDRYEKSLEPELRMMFRRAVPECGGPWDVNRLILRWCRFDFLSVYSLDKPAFYELFEAMDPRMQDFAITWIQTYYAADRADVWRRKAEFRERIFGIHQL